MYCKTANHTKTFKNVLNEVSVSWQLENILKMIKPNNVHNANIHKNVVIMTISCFGCLSLP